VVRQLPPLGRTGAASQGGLSISGVSNRQPTVNSGTKREERSMTKRPKDIATDRAGTGATTQQDRIAQVFTRTHA
jgi:hypothetical protein